MIDEDHYQIYHCHRYNCGSDSHSVFVGSRNVWLILFIAMTIIFSLISAFELIKEVLRP